MAQSKHPYVVIGYVSGDGWTKKQLDVNHVTHINYAFAVPAKDGGLEPLNEHDDTGLKALGALRAQHKGLQILLSIGGWGGCKYFSDAALTEASRKKFAEAAVAVLNKYKLDGIDIDWEYPAQIGAGNIYRPEDKQNYTLFLKALRDRLDQQGKLDKRTGAAHYLLTSATGGDTAFVSHTELGKAQRYLDYVNIMTYDLYNGNDHITGHHSPLYQSDKAPHARTGSVTAVEGHIRAGVPAHKIVLGVPFYGRGWADAKPENKGLYQPAPGKHSFIGYDELVANYINKNGYTRYWDDVAKSPYLWNPTTRTFISYADPESLQNRVQFVKAKHLAGVMFWEYLYDIEQKNILVKSLVKDLHD